MGTGGGEARIYVGNTVCYKRPTRKESGGIGTYRRSVITLLNNPTGTPLDYRSPSTRGDVDMLELAPY